MPDGLLPHLDMLRSNMADEVKPASPSSRNGVASMATGVLLHPRLKAQSRHSRRQSSSRSITRTLFRSYAMHWKRASETKRETSTDEDSASDSPMLGEDEDDASDSPMLGELKLHSCGCANSSAMFACSNLEEQSTTVPPPPGL